MKTFNYESNCVKYKNCFFDLGEYEKGKLSLAIYGYVEDDKNLSHISNVTVNVEEKLEENQVVIDNYANSNLISFLLDLGIVKNIPTITTVSTACPEAFFACSFFPAPIDWDMYARNPMLIAETVLPISQFTVLVAPTAAVALVPKTPTIPVSIYCTAVCISCSSIVGHAREKITGSISFVP